VKTSGSVLRQLKQSKRESGGSGLIGSKLVNKLRDHGLEAVPASPNSKFVVFFVKDKGAPVLVPAK
jgi:hypothetical protein